MYRSIHRWSHNTWGAARVAGPPLQAKAAASAIPREFHYSGIAFITFFPERFHDHILDLRCTEQTRRHRCETAAANSVRCFRT